MCEAKQRLNLGQVGLQLECGSQLRNRRHELTLEEKQHPEVGVSLDVFWIEQNSSLKLRNCFGGIMLRKILLRKANMTGKLSFLICAT